MNKLEYKNPIITEISWVVEDGTEFTSGVKAEVAGKIVSGISLERILELFGIEYRNDFNDDFRLRYPPKYRAEDGHLVRSRGELLIDNWLFNHGLTHSYEKKVPVTVDMYTDFYLNEKDIYVEYWGLSDEKYLKRKERKLGIYKENGLTLLSVENEHIEKLDDYLSSKLLI